MIPSFAERWSIKSNFSQEVSDAAIVLIGKNISFKEDQENYKANKATENEVGCLYWKDQKGRYLGCNEQMRKLTNLLSLALTSPSQLS